jgi:signal transduction histidine kinase
MKRISTRFAILFALAGVVPLLTYGGVAIYSLRSVAEQQVLEASGDTAIRVGEQIELYVSSMVRILDSLASELQQTGLAPWQQDRILKNHGLDFSEFAELTVIDDSGRVIASSLLTGTSTDIPGMDSVRIRSALMSTFSVDRDLLPTAVVAIEMKGIEGNRWLLGRLNLEQLWRIVDSIRVGEEGYALIVTNEGLLVAHGSQEEKPNVAANENLSSTELVRAVRATADTEATSASARYVRRGISMLGVGTYLQDLRWMVMVEQPVSQAFAFADSQQRQLAFTIGIALMAMLGIGYFWGRSFIVPILRLTRATAVLADGRLDERVTVKSKDELGQLGNAFNNMADRLVELQNDLVKKERQATFGRVAVGLVHDLSNPIQNIGNACKMIVMMFDDLDYRESFKRTVDRELAQIKRMLDDLRNIAKPMPLERFPIEVNKALGEVVDSMRPTAETSGLTLETAFADGQVFIQGDLFALNRVYRNLITNAFQATPPQGRVMVRTIAQDEHALIEIADTGSGIPPDRLAAIFEDFVTTKKRGLGLGLAMAKRVVEQLGGTISVTSEVGRGTTFTLRFPLTRERPPQLTKV